jgi:hypothetical protein
MEGQTIIQWFNPNWNDWFNYKLFQDINRMNNKFIQPIEKTGYCSLCSIESDTHIHHIVPLAHGGANTKDNTIEVCIQCHCKLHKYKNGYLNKKLSQMLGHADIKVTMQYLKIVPIDLGKELIKVVF